MLSEVEACAFSVAFHPSTARLCHNAVSLGLDPDEVGSVTRRFSVKRCWEVTSKNYRFTSAAADLAANARTDGTCNCDTACLFGADSKVLVSMRRVGSLCVRTGEKVLPIDVL